MEPIKPMPLSSPEMLVTVTEPPPTIARPKRDVVNMEHAKMLTGVPRTSKIPSFSKSAK